MAISTNLTANWLTRPHFAYFLSVCLNS